MKFPSLKPVAVVATAAVLALSACATATPYGPAGPGNRYGYSEQRVGPDRYRVSFAGNSVTAREQVEMSLLLRAAEVTVENGYDWFATVNRSTDRDTRYYASPDPFYNGHYGRFWSPYWRFYRGGYWSRWDPFWGPDYDVHQVTRYEASADIALGHGTKPVNDPNAFDAREVIQNLGPRVPRAS
jgi:hypothetical protein